MSEGIVNLLNQWQEQADRIRTAAGNRNYEMFSLAFKKGCKVFNLIKAELESGRREHCLTHHAAALRTAAETWLALNDELKIWMEEIRREAAGVRHAGNLDRKISGTYGYIRKTGNTLRLSR